MPTLPRIPAIVLLLAATFSLAGCIATHTGQLTIPSDVVTKSTFYVEQSEKDARNLSAIIAERMQARGLNARAGTAGPQDASYIVTYVDRWAWDMRMYLRDMRIELRDAKDKSIVGFGDASQTSLAAMGKTYADVIDIALNELFKK
jgi:hypothetical protein